MSFEKKLDQLEGLVKKMEEGGLKLDELITVYEQGTKLSQELGQELERVQSRMQQLKNGALSPATEEQVDDL